MEVSIRALLLREEPRVMIVLYSNIADMYFFFFDSFIETYLKCNTLKCISCCKLADVFEG